MEFANPERLHLLYLVPIIVLLSVYGARKRRDELISFTGPRLAEALAPGRSWRKSFLKGILKCLGVAFLIIALAGPRFGTHLVKVDREGIDIVIVLDTSLSMLAEDMKPNRLERAKQEIVDLVKGLHGDRVGLVVFAGDAFALCPLTVDYDAALMFVRSVDIDAVPEPGTTVGKAIAKSVALFEHSERRDRAIILVTDGESHEGDPVAEARIAGDKGIKIYAIGIGNPSGELIPMRGTGGGIEGYKKDNRGETVLTRLDESTLQEIASASKGQYLPATRQGLELKVLYNEIAGMDQRTIEGEFVERAKDRFPIFIALAFCFLLVDVLIIAGGRKRSTGRAKLLHTGASGMSIIIALVSIFSLVMLASPALAKKIDRGKVKAGNEYYGTGQYDKALYLYNQALGDTVQLPKDPEGVLYNQGNALYMMEKYQEALERYQMSFSEDTTLTGRMLYNRGNTLLKQGQLKEAIESYANSLRFLPDDGDARHNLEVALRMLEQQQQQQQQQQDGQDGDQQEEQENQEQQSGDQQQQQQDQQKDQQQGDQDHQEQNQQAADSTQANPASGDSTQSQPLDPEQLQELSKEDAMRILKALEEEEKKLQRERRKAAFKKVRKKGKDW
jgi:Ca-activated chloride channel family protein